MPFLDETHLDHRRECRYSGRSEGLGYEIPSCLPSIRLPVGGRSRWFRHVAFDFCTSARFFILPRRSSGQSGHIYTYTELLTTLVFVFELIDRPIKLYPSPSLATPLFVTRSMMRCAFLKLFAATADRPWLRGR